MSNKIWLPKGYTWRELWETRNMVGAKIPSSLSGGLPMTITSGATKGMACEGIHYGGTATSYLDCGAIHNAATKWLVSVRFKLDTTYTVGSGDSYLIQKRVDGDNKLTMAFDTTSGKLGCVLRIGAADKFLLYAAIGGADVTSWTGGTWYHILFSISSAAGVRLRCNGSTAVTNVDTTSLPNGGNLVFGNSSTYGAAGFKGIITDIQMRESVDLTSDQEYQTYLGTMTTPDEYYPCVTGYGLTVTSRGSAANNGTISTGNYWAKGSVTPPIKANGYNNSCNTAATGDMSGAISLVWLGRAKIRYGDSLTPASVLFGGYDGTGKLLLQGNGTSHDLQFTDTSMGIADTTDCVMDEYEVMVGTKTAGGATYFWRNGRYVGTGVSTSSLPNTGVTWYLGNWAGGIQTDPSQCILAGVVNGRLTSADVQKLTKTLKSHYGV